MQSLISKRRADELQKESIEKDLKMEEMKRQIDKMWVLLEDKVSYICLIFEG